MQFVPFQPPKISLINSPSEDGSYLTFYHIIDVYTFYFCSYAKIRIFLHCYTAGGAV